MMDCGKLFQELFECYMKLMADKSARESQRRSSIKAESKATPELIERRIKDKIVETETVVISDCSTIVLFPFVLSLVSFFVCCSSMFCSF
jgi:hypothetical protein